MPGRDLIDHLSSPAVERSPLLKSHKVFPRRPTDALPTPDPSPAAQRARMLLSNHPDALLDDGTDPSVSSPPDTISTGPPPLPPTPPSNPREVEVTLRSSPADSLDSRSLRRTHTDRDAADGLRTPLNQRSPPTPDITPPRALHHTSALRPPLVQRDPSSRTASFKTAREDQWSSDDERPTYVPPSHNTLSRRRKASPVDAIRHGNGLGIALESLDRRRGDGDMFTAFDGDWARKKERAAPNGMNGDRNGDNFPKNERSPPQQPKISSLNARSTSLDHQVPSMGVVRDSSLRDRIYQKQADVDRRCAELYAEQMSLPADFDDFFLESIAPHVDSNRFSGISTGTGTSDTSTIVEAFVVDHPPRRRPTLRHSRKNATLREHHTIAARSVSLPTKPEEISHRLVHKRLKIPTKFHDGSLEELQPQDHADVDQRDPRTVLPHDRSVSLPVSGLGRDMQRSPPVTQSQVQPPTLPSDSEFPAPNGTSQAPPAPYAVPTEFFEPHRSKKRTLSDTASFPKPASIADSIVPPVIPKRSSSLSAPTSRNVSRTASLKSNSIATRESVRDRDTTLTRRKTSKERSSAGERSQSRGEQSSAKYLSAPITPFSTISNPSSTPEALEVSEATAVNIYPHQNKSLLVVQQQSRPVSNEFEPPLPTEANGHVVENGLTPDSFQMMIDSPLKNPREPPEPPAVKIIPPTPHVMTPFTETEVRDAPSSGGASSQTSERNRPTSSGGAFALVRRALSSRRYSDSFAAPAAALVGRFRGVDEATQTPSTSSRQRPVLAGDEKEVQLSPFWRPRGFWDDLEFDDEDLEDEFLERGRSELLELRAGPHYRYHSMSSRPASRPWDEDGSAHDGDLRERLGRWFMRTGPMPRPKIFRSNSERRPTSSRSAAAAIPSDSGVGWRAVQRRLSGARAARAEKARERERLRMKKRISIPTVIEPHAI
ncbi:MAG: hypothetical protein M4579_002983 [Chaenotheca gracillima]|nr:MAG: hypothetical protein M4579_002983 [Chaenotheca gracillima]